MFSFNHILNKCVYKIYFCLWSFTNQSSCQSRKEEPESTKAVENIFDKLRANQTFLLNVFHLSVIKSLHFQRIQSKYRLYYVSHCSSPCMNDDSTQAAKKVQSKNLRCVRCRKSDLRKKNIKKKKMKQNNSNGISMLDEFNARRVRF